MTEESNELKNSTYEIFIGLLSILSIANIALILFARSDVVDSVIVIIDGMLSLIFLGDFAFRIFTADSKREYFFRQFGWADLAAAIPLPQAKFLRLFRVFRAGRLMREQGPARMIHDFSSNRAQSALLVVFLLIIMLLEFGGMGVAWAEDGAEGSNIDSGSDAIWWAYVTITTVGYGDQFPVTDLGRLIGVLVLTAGVGLFAVLTGFLANFFLTPPKERRARRGIITMEPKSLLAAARVQLASLEKQSAELRARLSEIERTL